MKRYILFIFLIGMITHQTYASPLTEIAINMQGQPIKRGMKIFLPVTIYRCGTLWCGGFIPLHALDFCDDGYQVTDISETRYPFHSYICKQSHASEKQSFADAVRKIMRKPVKEVPIK